MTAPRTCRKCGTPLSPTVRWCSLCLEPVRELSRRPTDDGTYVGPPVHEIRYSRWRRGPLTFGPAGRVAITIVVLLVGAGGMVGGFNPGSLWFLCGYGLAASLILKQTWSRVKIPETEGRRPPPEPHARHPVLFARVDPRILAGALGLIAIAAAFGVVRHWGLFYLFTPIAILIMLGVGAFMAWLAGI